MEHFGRHITDERKTNNTDAEACRRVAAVISTWVSDAVTLTLSPNHRVFLSDWPAETMFGVAEALGPIKSLVDGQFIMFEAHELLFANGAVAESLHTGEQSSKAIIREVTHENIEVLGLLRVRANQTEAVLVRPT